MESLDVLVVDDEFGIRAGISRILRNFSVSYPFLDNDIQFITTEVGSGEEALDIIKTNPPAIILLDNKLPGIQGVEVLEYINTNQLDILVIMITSYASLDLAVKATNIGAYDFVPKPFTPQELKSSLENVAKHYFLRRMTRKLHSEGKKVRFQFLNVLSHELKAPLSLVEENLISFKERRLGDDLAAYDKLVDKSLSKIKSMRNLIMDLLDLTRIESGGNERVLREVNLCLIAKTSIDTMMPMAIQRGVSIDFNSSCSVPYIADAQELEIVFNNLISNAIKFNEEGGKVHCQLTSSDTEIIITVSDSGQGIAQEDISKLFHEFSLIGISNAKGYAGSGLGLSIVKRIVDLYKGRIEVESKLNDGTTFSIYFPKI